MNLDNLLYIAPTSIGSAYLSLAVSSIIGVFYQQPITNCGLGSPSLTNWVLGTGISYIVLGFALSAVGVAIRCAYTVQQSQNRDITVILLTLNSLCLLFTTIWSVIGGISLWRDGYSCFNTNLPLWIIGIVNVISSYLLVVSITLFCIFKIVKYIRQ